MPIVLGPGEIDHYKRVRPQVSFPAAHKFLTELRDLHGHTQNNVFLHDLTDSLKFNWKVWVSQRPDAADIVGLGINRFAFVWLSSMDSNTKERRGDFLVQRVDGIDIRLHPQQKPNRETGLKEAIPVRGSWEKEWCPETSPALQHEALAASQGQASSMFGQASTFQGISPADAVGSKDAIWFLKHEEATWYKRPHPCGPFRVDITGGVSASSQRKFQWPYFVLQREWFRQHFADLGFHITAFEVAWSNRGSHAVFLGQRSDGCMFTVNPRVRQAAELHWDTHDIAEI